MSQPTSTMIVTNNSQVAISMGGPYPQTVAAGGQATWTSAQMPALCADVNFRAAFLAGSLGVQVNGNSLPSPTTSPQVSAFLDDIASQVIVLT
jgi:hypothetical protein